MAKGQHHHGMQCMEIWGSSQLADTAVSTPGLDIYVLSKPYQGSKNGGDVHYVSLCGGGITTRVIVADLCGHGEGLAEQARALRTLMRRNINRKKQHRLVEALNKQYAESPKLEQFATMVVATYLASRQEIMICSAGHPHPLWYAAAEARWLPVRNKSKDGKVSSNFPLGVIAEATFEQSSMKLGKGDIILLYTDALTEACDPSGKQLGEDGLLEMVQTLDAGKPESLGPLLIEKISAYRATEAGDDLTLLTLAHNASRPPRLSLGQKLDVYAKVFGLKHV
jgi:sigma-B regulation protein RsbU (phosphoserine phosphatase)